MCVTRPGSSLSCLSIAGVSAHDSGSLFVCSVSQYCVYDTDDVASLLTQNKVHLHNVSQTFFAKCAWGRFSALGNAMHAVRTQCEVLDVGKYSNPSFGPFSQVFGSVPGFFWLPKHLAFRHI